MNYNRAKALADRIVEIFTPHCDLIHIAGSIRREKPEVKDIEIVCRPKRTFTKTDLFGGGFDAVVPEFSGAIERISDHVIKGAPTGRYMQLVLKGKDEMKCDVFMPELHDYYRQLAIRTGSAEYSAKVIATAWVKLGWCGTEQGLRRIEDCVRTASGWKVINLNGSLPPAWRSEEEFFEWLRVPFLLPDARI